MTANYSDGERMQVRMSPLSGAIALAVGSMTVGGTNASAADGYFDDEMIVTSTRRESNVQDVPFNIAAFSGETLQKQRLNNLSEFARWVPGLTFTDQGQRGSSLLTVRGLNASSIQAQEALGNSGGETVATYVGEVPVFVDLKPYDMSRVEVLIGPQGTLYGAGTLAGAVRFIPNRPNLESMSLDIHAKTYLQKESDDYGIGGDATFNLPIIPDVLGFRGTLGFVDEAGFIDYNYLVQNVGFSNPEPDFTNPADVAANLASRKDANDEKTLNVRTALRYDIGEPVSLNLRYDYQNKKSGGRQINHMDSIGTGRYESAMRVLEPNKREHHIVEFLIEANLGFADLTSATGWSQYEDDGNRDQTDLLLNFEYGYGDFPAFTAFTRDTDDQTILTQEIRLVSTHEGPVSWIVGGFYSKFDQDAVSLEFTPQIPEFFGIAPPPLPTGDIEYQQLTKDELEEMAAFGEVTWQILDRWQVTGGLRWYDYDTDTSIAVDIPLIGSVNNPFENAKSADSGVIYKLNTSVSLDDQIPGMSQGNLYATVSEGYRVGGANLFAACQIPLPPGQNVCLLAGEQAFEPDETVNYEIGFKSTWWDDAILLNVAGFYIDWSDIQLATISINGDVPITTNASDAESMGVEIQSRITLAERFSIQAAYAYTKAELSKNAPAIVGVRVGNPVDAFSGDRLPGTPEHQGSLNFNYTQPIDGDLTLDFDYGLVYQSDVLTKVGMRGSGEALAGFAVHHLSGGVSNDTFSARLYIDNLFDKYAETGVRSDTDFIARRADGNGLEGENFTLRRYYHNVIRPRQIGVDFTYNFTF